MRMTIRHLGDLLPRGQKSQRECRYSCVGKVVSRIRISYCVTVIARCECGGVEHAREIEILEAIT